MEVMIHERADTEAASTTEHATADEPAVETRLYDLVADVRVAGEELLLCDALSECRDVRVVPDYVRRDGGERTLLFTAVGDDLDAFERAAARDATVTDVAVVSTASESRSYRARLTVDCPLLSPLGADARACETYVDGSGWWLRIQFDDRDALVAFNEYCRDRGLEPTVARLGTGGDAPGLTTEQRDLLRTAYEAGYYETPRETSQEQLASSFDISPSSVSQRLRRATAELVENTIESGPVH